jgi:pimeloyl-ACP methyl ester carboxylesterase
MPHDTTVIGPRAIETSELRARTSDGVSLAITRVCDASRPSRGAVMLQHGLASNGGAFIVPQQSFAGHLAELGYDAYVTELRGCGKSETAKEEAGYDAFMERDLPALIEAVLASSGHDQLAFVGHSMGGIMGLSYGIEHKDAPLSCMLAVCSSLDYRAGENEYQRLNKIKPLARLLPFVPFKGLAKLNSFVAGVGPVFPPEGMNFWRSNVERGVLRYCLANGFERIPIRLLEDLSRTFDEAGFSRDTGKILYHQRACDYALPTLLIAGSRDVQCPPDTVAATFELLTGCPSKEVFTLGKAHGHADEYGHFDPLVGKRAPQEAWPVMTAFLDRVAIARAA